VEIILKKVIMRNDLVISIMKNGRIMYDDLNFNVRIEVEYYDLNEELIKMEENVKYNKNKDVGINVGF
jgi:hypothetical protein